MPLFLYSFIILHILVYLQSIFFFFFPFSFQSSWSISTLLWDDAEQFWEDILEIFQYLWHINQLLSHLFIYLNSKVQHVKFIL